MSIISNTIDSIYNGVSQQPKELRLPTQVEEMINCVPTVDRGCRRRNPTSKVNLKDSLGNPQSIEVSNERWSTMYDRGLSGSSREQYRIAIDNNGMYIVDVNSGRIFSESDGITYNGNSKSYLFPFAGANGYAATTVKDTTFIVNRNISPRMVITSEEATTGDETATTVQVATVSLGSGYEFYGRKIVPTSIRYYIETTDATEYIYICTFGSRTVFNVDGKHIEFVQPSKSYQNPSRIPLISEWVVDVKNELDRNLDGSIYSVSISDSNSEIVIKSVNDSLSVTYAMTFPIPEEQYCSLLGNEYYISVSTHLTPLESDYITGVAFSTADAYIPSVDTSFGKVGYAWVRLTDPQYGYDYHLTVNALDADGNVVATQYVETLAAKLSTTAVSNLATAINGGANFTAYNSGSQLKVISKAGYDIQLVASDSFGSTAMSAWTKEVNQMGDLPKKMEFQNVVVRVSGTSYDGFGSYYVRFNGEMWIECESPENSYNSIDANTMPHVLVREADGTFSLSAYDKWTDRKIGDDETNELPQFVKMAEGDSEFIKDIFFFKNRLGFVTSRGVAMSETGVYGNFFRTTTLDVLDSDPINTYVDTTSVINLEYASQLSGAIILFADKQQFSMRGGDILSPSSVSVSSLSSYEINTSIRPVAIEDRIFFVANRGDNSAVFEYFIAENYEKASASEVTGHVQSYIPSGIKYIAHSQINNMLMLSDGSDTVWCYKYLDSNKERIQSAWFKWTFNGSVGYIGSVSDSIYIDIARIMTAQDAMPYLWNDSFTWDDNLLWSDDAYPVENNIEKMYLFPADSNTSMLDIGSYDYDSIIELSEWVMSIQGAKENTGDLQFMTVKVNTEDGSSISVDIENTSRSLSRNVLPKYASDRSIIVFGKAKDTKITIKSDGSSWFQVNSVNYEGNYVARSRRFR